MPTLNMRSGSAGFPSFQLSQAMIEELEAALGGNITPQAQQKTERLVSLYLHQLPLEFDADSKPIRDYYIKCQKALNRAASIIAKGPVSNDKDVLDWARLGYQTSKSLREDPNISKLESDVRAAATNFGKALEWLALNETSSIGRRTNDALDSFVMRMAMDAAPLLKITASEYYSDYRSVRDGDLAGSHATPFVQFMNVLYSHLPEEAQILSGGAKEGPMTSTIRRVLKELRRRGDLRQEAHKK